MTVMVLSNWGEFAIINSNAGLNVFGKYNGDRHRSPNIRVKMNISLPVCVTSMTDNSHINNFLIIIDNVNNSIYAHPYPPEKGLSFLPL
jgi:hypothetical protein